MTLDDVVTCARFARQNDGTGPLSTGESLIAAVVLNRADWLQNMGYTILEALVRIGSDAKHLVQAERIVRGDG
ncbi:hypothetical protein [Pseudoxanthomonas sp. SE1]|uniref:hypothetical protein n=1 Tax=Pseudoxanthomonas sp. SE1 TaxID=1664560 RepID=UPI00240D417D|nr:hypothetical protein [Pseudoxanthomonas sp. SE1]WFC43203.1 hypothetical protein OY559_06750 [Pseudoxanthomonas sp. SE1]